MSDQVSKEAGMVIVKQTLCRVGAHMFMKATLGAAVGFRPHERCDCGLLTYSEANDAT